MQKWIQLSLYKIAKLKMPKISVDTIPDREAVLDGDSILGGSDLQNKLEINEIARQSVR